MKAYLVALFAGLTLAGVAVNAEASVRQSRECRVVNTGTAGRGSERMVADFRRSRETREDKRHDEPAQK